MMFMLSVTLYIDYFQTGFITFELRGTSLGGHYFGIRQISATEIDVYIKTNLQTGFRTLDTFVVRIVLFKHSFSLIFSLL